LDQRREEITGLYRKLHNGSLTTYSSQNIITVKISRMVGWDGLVAHIGEIRNGYKILVRRPVGNRGTWGTKAQVGHYY
jgi:hypothetical protein